MKNNKERLDEGKRHQWRTGPDLTAGGRRMWYIHTTSQRLKERLPGAGSCLTCLGFGHEANASSASGVPAMHHFCRDETINQKTYF